MHQPRVSLLHAAALCAIATTCAHANDNLDTSWNGSGTLVMPVSGYNVGTTAGMVQPDGRILLASDCFAGTSATICMTRLQANGLRDYNFGPSQTGVFTFSEFPSWPITGLVRGLSRQSDGRIIAAGGSRGSETDDTTTYASVTRLTADGTLDPSVPAQPLRFEYSHNTISSQSEVTATALQTDGKLVAAGITFRAGTNPPNFDFAVARLRTDLTLDPSFNDSGIRVAPFDLGGDDTDAPLALAIQRDGKIVVAGSASTTSNGLDAAVLRLNPDGTPDSTFGNVGRATFDFNAHHLDDQIGDVKIDAAGRIWLAGSYQWTGTDSDFFVARLRADGTLDSDFCNGNGFRTVAFDLDGATTDRKTDAALRLLLQPDGKIVLIGNASNGAADGYGSDFAAARLLPDCSLDSTFGTNGKLHDRYAGATLYNAATDAVFGGGGIVLSGYAASSFDTIHQPTDGQFGVAMIRIDLIFANGFDMP